MIQAYVSLGSNVRAEANICSCTHYLQARFRQVISSAVYRTPAIGFKGDPFLNSVIGFATSMPVAELRTYLRELEAIHGRVRSTDKFAPRTLDLDLLLYGDTVLDTAENLPHRDILQYAFVLYPLAEIAPNQQHPVLRQELQHIARHSVLSPAAMQAITLDCNQYSNPLTPIPI